MLDLRCRLCPQWAGWLRCLGLMHVMPTGNCCNGKPLRVQQQVLSWQLTVRHSGASAASCCGASDYRVRCSVAGSSARKYGVAHILCRCTHLPPTSRLARIAVQFRRQALRHTAASSASCLCKCSALQHLPPSCVPAVVPTGCARAMVGVAHGAAAGAVQAAWHSCVHATSEQQAHTHLCQRQAV